METGDFKEKMSFFTWFMIRGKRVSSKARLLKHPLYTIVNLKKI
jgi:hypothetical protein